MDMKSTPDPFSGCLDPSGDLRAHVPSDPALISLGPSRQAIPYRSRSAAEGFWGPTTCTYVPVYFFPTRRGVVLDRDTEALCVTSAHFLFSFLAGSVVVFCSCSLGHMQSSSGDCPLEGRARVVPCLESGSMPGRWHARGRTEHASLQGAATYILVAPWLAQLGVHRPRRRAHSLPSSYWGLPLSLLSGFLSALCLHVSHGWPVFHCTVFSSRLRCLRVVCINMNVRVCRTEGLLLP